jgi:RNA polymerase sigma factor FliA
MIPLLRAHTLCAATTAEDEASLVTRHAGMIDRVARRIAAAAGQLPLREDLWSVGALGVIDAARRFDGARGVRFEAFAEHRVRGAMLDELRRMDHLPRRLRERTKRVAKVRSRLSQDKGSPATDAEVAASLGISMEELAKVEAASQPLMPLDPEMAARLDEPTPEAQVERKHVAAALAECVKRLPERMQLLLALHYQEDCTYREIAVVLGVSEARICQLHGQALGRLRKGMKKSAA